MDHLDSSNSRRVCQRIQNFRTNLRAADGDIVLAEELNIFAHFKVTPPEIAPLRHTAHSSINLTAEGRAVTPRKAGPDGVLGHVLKDCADQLAGVFTKIFSPWHSPLSYAV